METAAKARPSKGLRSFGLTTYLTLSTLLAAPIRSWARRRHRMMGAAPDRFAERLGHSQSPRPDGRLIWVHAASVGETLSVLGLVTDLLAARPDLHILLTTTTASAADMAARRLPARCIHQFAPIDLPGPARRFADHWRPDAALIAESDLMPRLLGLLARRSCALVLLAARASRTRTRLPGLSRAVLHPFALITCQTKAVQEELIGLGLLTDRLMVTGDLKAAADPLPVDATALEAMRSAIGPRPVWTAASTHDGEEAMLIAAHQALLADHPDALLILIPRHPDRGPAIADLIRSAGLGLAIRSAGALPTADSSVYLADTIGETGLFYALSPVTLVGGSLRDVGGHNPYEPAGAGSAVLHGPLTGNFSEAYAEMDRCGAARVVSTPTEIKTAITDLQDSATRTKMTDAATGLLAAKQGARAATLTRLQEVLP